MSTISDTEHIADVISEFKLKGKTLANFRTNAALLLTRTTPKSTQIFLDSASDTPEFPALQALALRARNVEVTAKDTLRRVVRRYPSSSARL